ncbi:MAG: hypothetical protein IJP01_00120 [Oscillospiraceae bacterium]|nr:hypothetical protein [Oscillospiraceae bacterium]
MATAEGMADMFEQYFAALRIRVSAQRIGSDIQVTVAGGDGPHIGCVAIGEPDERLSAAGLSATVSVHNICGHRDGEIAVPIAKQLAAALRCRTVVVAGVHYNSFSPELLKETAAFTEQLAASLTVHFQNN